MKKGQLKANGIAISEITVTYNSRVDRGIRAVIRFVDTESGTTHATATVAKWSPEVDKKLDELIDAMEQSAGSVLFSGGAQTSPEKPGLRFEEPLGLGEHVAGDEQEVPQITPD